MVSERRRPKVLTGDSSGFSRLFFFYCFLFRSYCLVSIWLLCVLFKRRDLGSVLGLEVSLLDLSDLIMKRFVGCFLK